MTIGVLLLCLVLSGALTLRALHCNRVNYRLAVERQAWIEQLEQGVDELHAANAVLRDALNNQRQAVLFLEYIRLQAGEYRSKAAHA